MNLGVWYASGREGFGMADARLVYEIDVVVAVAKHLLEDDWALRALDPHTLGMTPDERETALARLEWRVSWNV